MNRRNVLLKVYQEQNKKVLKKLDKGGMFKSFDEEDQAKIQGAGMLAEGVTDIVSPMDKYGTRSRGGAAASGAVKGAMAGAALGPAGMAGGAVIGAAVSLVGNKKALEAKQQLLTDTSEADAKARDLKVERRAGSDATLTYGRQSSRMYKFGGNFGNTVMGKPAGKFNLSMNIPKSVGMMPDLMPDIAISPGKIASKEMGGNLPDDPIKKAQMAKVKPRPFQPDITLPNWDGLVQKDDGSIGMWGNDIVTGVKTPIPKVEVPLGKTDHNGRQSGHVYQGTTAVRDKIFEMEKKLKAGSNMKGYRKGGIMPTSSTTSEVKGPKHEQGGVKIPERGVEVEGGESIAGDFVFSDALGFAEIHNRIGKGMGKNEKRPETVLNKRTGVALKRKEGFLKIYQEEAKRKAGLPNEIDNTITELKGGQATRSMVMRMGGTMPKMRDGGEGPEDDFKNYLKKKAKSNTGAFKINPNELIDPGLSQFGKKDAAYYFYGDHIGSMGKVTPKTKKTSAQIKADAKANPEQWKKAVERAETFRTSRVESVVGEGLNAVTGYKDADWKNHPIASAFNAVQGMAGVVGGVRGTIKSPASSTLKTPNTVKQQLKLQAGNPSKPLPANVKQSVVKSTPGNGATAADYPAAPQAGTNSGTFRTVQGQYNLLNPPMNLFEKPGAGDTPSVVKDTSPSKSKDKTSTITPERTGSGGKGKPTVKSATFDHLPEVEKVTKLTGASTKPTESGIKLELPGTTTAIGLPTENAAPGQSNGKTKLGDALGAIAPFASNIANAFRKLPAPPKPVMDDEIDPNLINLDASRSEAVRQRRGADKVAAATLNGNNAVAATKAANLTAQMREMNDINQTEQNANTQIKNQAQGVNAQIKRGNNLKQDYFNTQQVERQLKQQQLSADNLADVGNKMQAISRDKAAAALDDDKMLLTIAQDDTGATIRAGDAVLKRRLSPEGYKAITELGKRMEASNAEDRKLLRAQMTAILDNTKASTETILADRKAKEGLLKDDYTKARTNKANK